MSDFFTRLAQRVLGHVAVVQPIIAPLYAFEQQAEGPIEMLLPVTGARPTSPTPVEQTPLVLSTHQPEDYAIPPQHTMLSPTTESEQESGQPSKRRGEQPLTDVSSTSADRSSQRNTLPAPVNVMYQQIESTTKHVFPTTITKISSSLPSTSQTSPFHEERLPAIPVRALEKESSPEERPRQTAREGKSIQPQVLTRKEQRGLERVEMHVAPRPQHVPAPVQVTIGRIEVRATTTSAAKEQAQRPRATQPTMSLEDYLRQASNGGR